MTVEHVVIENGVEQGLLAPQAERLEIAELIYRCDECNIVNDDLPADEHEIIYHVAPDAPSEDVDELLDQLNAPILADLEARYPRDGVLWYAGAHGNVTRGPVKGWGVDGDGDGFVLIERRLAGDTEATLENVAVANIEYLDQKYLNG